MTATRLSGELTYGLERLAMYVLGIDHVMDMPFNDPDAPIALSYGDVFRQTEEEYSRHNFDLARPRCSCAISRMRRPSASASGSALTTTPRPASASCWRIPAYDQCIKASHLFNLLDARGVISVTERQAYIGRVRALAKLCADAFLASDAGGWVPGDAA
jgi:glycyl-tRNA synthetase alpha chain